MKARLMTSYEQRRRLSILVIYPKIKVDRSDKSRFGNTVKYKYFGLMTLCVTINSSFQIE